MKDYRLTVRDLQLIKKVGKYYLQYIRVIDMDTLLKKMKRNSEYENTIALRNALNGIYYYVLYILTIDVVKSAKEAYKDKLVRKEFSNEFASEIHGALDIPRSLMTYPSKIYSYYTYQRGADSSTFAVLGALLREIYRNIFKLKNELEKYYEESHVINYFQLNDFNDYVNLLCEYKDRFRKGKIREPIEKDPSWLKRAFKIYITLEKMIGNEISLGNENSILPKDKDIIKMSLWKLYELYVFYLLIEYFEKKGYKVKVSKKDKFDVVMEKDGKKKFITLNSSLDFSSLFSIDNSQKIEDFMGRPDIALINEKKIIFECKYSTSATYISQGRFKVMAYMYEYDPDIAILIYPGIERINKLNSDNILSEKIDESIRNKEKDKKYVKLIFKSRNNKPRQMYIVTIDPLTEENKQVMESIMNEIFV